MMLWVLANLLLLLLLSGWVLRPVEGSARFDHKLKGSNPMEDEPSFQAYNEDSEGSLHQVLERLVLLRSSLSNTNQTLTQDNDNYVFQYAALGSSSGKYHSAKASLSIHEIKNISSTQYSGALMWITRGDTSVDHDIISVGWMVSYPLYNDYKPRLTAMVNIINKGSCLNTKCEGYVQVHKSSALGMPLEPSALGEYKEITLEIYYDEHSGWWLDLNGEAIGYWPGRLFTSLRSTYEQLKMGGSVVTPVAEPSPGMGSGLKLSGTLWGRAAYVRNIEVLDESKKLVPAIDLLTFKYDESAPMYDVTDVMDGEGKGVRFYYGGEGGHNH